MSQEGHKDNQGPQPPEPLPDHPPIIQKARSVQVHQSWDRETEKQLLSQGHQTVKQPPLTNIEWLLPTHWLNSSHFNNGKIDVINVSLATLTIPLCLQTHLICIYCTQYHLLYLAYAALYHHSFIYLYVHIIYPLTLGSSFGIVSYISRWVLLHCRN